jgi:hypothetical protein
MLIQVGKEEVIAWCFCKKLHHVLIQLQVLMCTNSVHIRSYVSFDDAFCSEVSVSVSHSPIVVVVLVEYCCLL